MIRPGDLRQWDGSEYLPDEYCLQPFVVVSQSDQMNRSWWILMGGELIWETEDIIELHSDPLGM